MCFLFYDLHVLLRVITRYVRIGSGLVAACKQLEIKIADSVGNTLSCVTGWVGLCDTISYADYKLGMITRRVPCILLLDVGVISP